MDWHMIGGLAMDWEIGPGCTSEFADLRIGMDWQWIDGLVMDL